MRNAGYVRRTGVGVLAMLLCIGCQDSEPPIAQPAAQEQRAVGDPLAQAMPPVTTPQPESAREALPRTVVGITLGMSRSDAETQLGPLNCHENKASYQVCSGTKEQIDDARHIEVYLNHDLVISLSYEGPAPSNAWDALNQLIDRYGRPALSGMRERDKTGRLPTRSTAGRTNRVCTPCASCGARWNRRTAS